jgi:hypothetical protein
MGWTGHSLWLKKEEEGTLEQARLFSLSMGRGAYTVFL